MRAIYFDDYGDPGVLKLGEVPDPHPGPGEVRIRIHAAGVNPVDAKIRRGLVRPRLPHQLPIIPGWDAAGIIDEIGEGVTLYGPGDEVYAYCRKPVVQYGAYAESIVLPEGQVARKPVRASFAEAASIPLAALTAWQSLFDAAELKAGQSVLIHAGAGGVGGFAIQLAKRAGAFVLATASRKNHDYLCQLGADAVIDYTQVDFRDAVRASHPKGVDVVFDTVGGDVQAHSGDVARKDGIVVSILAFQDEEALKRRSIQTRYVFVAPHRDQLTELARIFDAGELSSRLADVLPLGQAAEAHCRIETCHTAGKIVLGLLD